MSDSEPVGKGTVSGTQVTIPEHIRAAFDIEDGDTLRWRGVDGELRVTVVSSERGAFDGFEPGASEESTDTIEAHDGFGVE